MNDLIREQVRAAMKAKGLTQTALAEQTGMKQPNVARLLSSNRGGGGVPEQWVRVLEVLDLHLEVLPNPKEEK
jgi:transcriptional regulator with XRE-family HTH domain